MDLLGECRCMDPLGECRCADPLGECRCADPLGECRCADPLGESSSSSPKPLRYPAATPACLVKLSAGQADLLYDGAHDGWVNVAPVSGNESRQPQPLVSEDRMVTAFRFAEAKPSQKPDHFPRTDSGNMRRHRLPRWHRRANQLRRHPVNFVLPAVAFAFRHQFGDFGFPQFA